MNQNMNTNNNNFMMDSGIKVKDESFSERKMSLRKPKNKGKII